MMGGEYPWASRGRWHGSTAEITWCVCCLDFLCVLLWQCAILKIPLVSLMLLSELKLRITIIKLEIQRKFCTTAYEVQTEKRSSDVFYKCPKISS